MREIFFKAKKLADGKWVEGYYQKRYNELGEEEHYIFWIKNYRVWAYEEVDPETLCQYIEIKDKNKKRIYEHEIVKATIDNIESIYQVTWDSYDFEYKLENKQECVSLACFDKSILEVIGNIFDNPELLEQ